jgi:aspartate/methionine/tyrosine aminotransferase
MSKIQIPLSTSMEITRRAAEMKKGGKEVFTLSVGDTHFAPPEVIRARMNNLPSAYSHYTPGDGIPELRKLVSEQYGSYSPNQVIVVPGLKQGLFYLMTVLEGQRVMVLEPAWLGYNTIISICGKTPLAVNFKSDNWREMLSNAEFDIILVCNPNNPDGRIFSSDELDFIYQEAKKNKAWIITDEIYDRYVYCTEVPKIDILEDYPLLVRCNGLSKSHAMTGFRIGFILTRNNELLQNLSAINQNTATCAPAISQYLALEFINALPEVMTFRDYYADNRNKILEFFPEWQPFLPQGGFYFFVNLSLYGIENADTFSSELLERAHVAVVPGSAYGRGFDSWVRISFSLEQKQLLLALQSLKSFINQYKA